MLQLMNQVELPMHQELLELLSLLAKLELHRCDEYLN